MLSVLMKGSGFERGRAQVQACKEQIKKAYAELCKPIKLSPEEKRLHIGNFLKKLEEGYPELIDEMRGMAAEAGLEGLDQIAELTLWEELKAYSSQQLVNNACTSIAFTRTMDGPLIGKTTDIEDFQRPYYILQFIEPEEGYSLLSMGKVGSIKTEVGLNEKGLSIATGSVLPLDGGEPGIERMTLARIVLQTCSDVDEAIALISQYNLIRLGLYFLLVDRSGKACVVEKSISHQGIRFPDEKGIIFATNFYMVPSMARYIDKSAFYYQNALERYINLFNLKESSLPQEGLRGMKKILQNHSPIGPICAHFKDLGMCSFYAFLIVPAERKLMITDGYPCQEEFKEFKI